MSLEENPSWEANKLVKKFPALCGTQWFITIVPILSQIILFYFIIYFLFFQSSYMGS